MNLDISEQRTSVWESVKEEASDIKQDHFSLINGMVGIVTAEIEGKIFHSNFNNPCKRTK